MITQVCECGAQSRRLRVFSEAGIMRIWPICQTCYVRTDPPELGQVTEVTVRDLVARIVQLEVVVVELSGDQP